MALSVDEEIELLELEKEQAMQSNPVNDNKSSNIDINSEKAKREQFNSEAGATPLGILDSAVQNTGKQFVDAAINTPGILAKSAIKTGGGILKGINQTVQHPIQTAIGIDKAIRNPVDTAKAYISGRYDTKENALNTVRNDPFGTLLDLSLVSGGAGATLKGAGNVSKLQGLTKTGNILNEVSMAPVKTVGAVGKLGKETLLESMKPPSPEQLIAKAEDITYKILLPAKKDIASALLKHQTEPAVREAARVIKKSNNFQELQLNIENEIRNIFQNRDKILRSNNYKMTDKHVRDLEDFINERASKGQVTDSELSQMQGVLAEERAWLAKNNKKFDRVSAQDRKEYLQNLTESLLQKTERGETIITQPFRKQALDILRNGLREGIEGNDKRVRALNSTYAGLKEAKQLVAEQSALVKREAKTGFVNRIAMLVTNPRGTIIDQAVNNLSSLSKRTAEIESLMQRAKSKSILDGIMETMDIEQGKSNVLALPYLTPQYLRERQAMNIESLGVEGKPRVFGIPEYPAIKAKGK